MPRAAAQLHYQYVGHRVVWEPADGFEILCVVRNARSVYGREELLLSPVVGRGERWVSERMVTYLSDADSWPHKSDVHLYDASSDLLGAMRLEGRDFLAALPTKVRTKMSTLDDALEPQAVEAE